MAGFSDLVTSTGWRLEVERWVADVVADRGGRVMSLEQPRVRPWSTQLVVTTDQGRLWFKATCRTAAFEPALQETLARLVPGDVDAPVAVDATRGWMLTTDRGPTLRDRHEPTPGDWAAVVARFARVQRALAPHRDAVLATGLPDCSPASVPGRFEAVLAALAGLPAGHPARPDPDLVDRLARAGRTVADAAALLGAGPFAPTLQHGDLHPGNVLVVGDELRVFDLGDAQWAHPLEVLEVPSAVVHHTGLPWDDVERAYRDAWSDGAGTALDDDAWTGLRRAAHVVHAVNRAWTWWGALAEASDAEWDDWGEAPARHLAGVLGPDGTG